MNIQLPFLIQLAGLSHLGLLCAGATMPKVVQLRTNIAALPPFIRRLFWVYYTFIACCLVGFGSISFLFADSLASGAPLARAICSFLAVFWTIRLVVALFVFDVRPYLVNAWLRIGHAATNTVFTALPLIYAWAAWKGASL